MAIETERKFLVANDGWRERVRSSVAIEQGYLAAESGRAVRVRLSGAPDAETAVLTIKFPRDGASNEEFEYPVPLEDARRMLEHSPWHAVRKTRHAVEFDGRTWEVDVFHDRLDGLVIAELEAPDAEEVNKFPPWLGKEVTREPYFKNANLARQFPHEKRKTRKLR